MYYARLRELLDMTPIGEWGSATWTAWGAWYDTEEGGYESYYRYIDESPWL